MYSVEELTGNNLINSSNLGNGLLHDFEQDSLLDNFKEAVKDKKFPEFDLNVSQRMPVSLLIHVCYNTHILYLPESKQLFFLRF